MFSLAVEIDITSTRANTPLSLSLLLHLKLTSVLNIEITVFNIMTYFCVDFHFIFLGGDIYCESLSTFILEHILGFIS